MPVKKNNSKKTAKKTAGKKKRKIDEVIEKNIQEAMENIPPQELPKEKNKSAYENYLKSRQTKRPIMWLGVILMAGVIFFMWAINTMSVFQDIKENDKKNEEIKLFSDKTQEMKNILSESQIQENLKKIKDQSMQKIQEEIDRQRLLQLVQNINEISSSSEQVATSTEILTEETNNETITTTTTYQNNQ